MHSEIILYSTGCPKCEILKKKLESAHICYTVNTDTDEMQKLGFQSLPMLSVSGAVFDFSEAVRWVGEYVSERAPSD